MAEAWWAGLFGLEGLEGFGDPREEPGEGLRLTLGEREWLLEGEAGESVTLTDPGGMTIYADLDGDGEVDHITTLPAGGGYEVWSADPHAAAWGLPGVGEGNGVPDKVGTWGLPPSSAPELGDSDSCPSQQNSGWWRIEREEMGRS